MYCNATSTINKCAWGTTQHTATNTNNSRGDAMTAPAAAAATSAAPYHPAPGAFTSAAAGIRSAAPPSSTRRNDVSTGSTGLGTAVASLPSGAREYRVGSSSNKNNSTAA
ncbi:unnamed protein product, partial [Ectocarpus fasciculatus]